MARANPAGGLSLILGRREEARERHKGIAMRRDQRWSILCDPLDDVLEACGAHKGNIQLVDGQGNLRIVASFGFDHRFLDFFAVVHTEGTACGAALKHGRQIVVTDVASSAIFAGTDAGEVLLSADCRAVQSTPLMHEGRVYGMISTHWRRPWMPRLVELRALGDAVDVVAPLVWRAIHRIRDGANPVPSVCA